MERKRSGEDGKRLLEEFARSGLTRREFCEQNQIPVTTLDYWRWKEGKAAKTELVKVTLSGESRSLGFTVVLANGRRIESAWAFQEAELANLIRVVESA